MKKTLEFKKNLKLAVENGDKNSIANYIEPEIDSLGKEKLAYTGPDNLNPALKAIVARLLNSDTKKHYRYCPCCKNYEQG